MKKALVKKSNELITSIEAHWKLNLIQSKMIAYLTSKIRKDDKDFKEYVFSIPELIEALNLHSKSYENLFKATRGILKKGYVEIDTPSYLLQTNILSSSKYNKEKNTVTLCFDPNLKPYYLQLQKAFTKYELENVLSLKSKYAIRMYEYCVMIKGAKRTECEINISIKKLRDYLQIEKKKYTLYSNFKNRILVPARKEINEHTDIHIDVRENKTKRKVTSLTFFVKNQVRETKKLTKSQKSTMFPSLELMPEKNEKWYQKQIDEKEDKKETMINYIEQVEQSFKKDNINKISNEMLQKRYEKFKAELPFLKNDITKLKIELAELQEKP